MRPADLPSGVRTTRVIVYVQGALNVLFGVTLVLGGSAVAHAYSWSGSGVVVLITAVGLAWVVVSGLLIWAGYLLGRLSRPARRWVIAYEVISIILGILSLTDLLQAGIRVVLAAVAIYYLQYEPVTKAAFAAPQVLPGAGRRRSRG